MGPGDRSPQWGPGAEPRWKSGEPPKAGDKYRLHKNTIKNTKHTGTEINTMKT